MNQEEKELLVKDLCSRLPYGVKVQFKIPNYQTDTFDDKIGDVFGIDTDKGLVNIHCKGIDYNISVSKCKPYLRTLSSMTEEEKDEYDRLVMCNASWVVDDWLNARHFDYRGLIDKGLALEAPKEMYK